MDEENFLRSATPSEQQIYERLNPQQRQTFLQSLAPVPRTNADNPEFQDWLSGQDGGTQQSFEAMSAQERDEAARMILLRLNQGIEYAGETQPRQYPEIPYLTSAGEEAGFRSPIRLPDFGAALDLFSSTPTDATGQALAQGALGEGTNDGGAQIALGGILSSSPDQYRDIIQSARPDSYFFQDDFGNPIVQFEGQGGERPMYYLGGEQEAIGNLLGQGALFMGAGRVGSGLLGRGMLGRTVGAGLADAGMSVGLDLASEALGSEQGIDTLRAVFSGAIGAGAELATPLVVGAARRLGDFVRNSNGNVLSPDMVAELRRAGIDPNNITGELVDRIRFYTDRGYDPAAAVVRAGSDQYNIPLTRGESMPYDAPRRPIEMQREYSMGSSSAYGTRAADTMNSFRNQQRQAVIGSQGRLADQMGVNQDLRGAGAIDPIQYGAATASRQADEAYRAADQAGVRIAGEAFHREGYDVGEDIMARAMESRGGLAFAPDSNVEMLTNRINALQGDVTLTEIENVRQSINRFIRDNAGNPDRAASGQDILRAFDEWAEETLDEYVMAGDAATGAQLYRDAREIWRDMRRTYTVSPRRSTRFGTEGADVGGQLIQDIVQNRVRPEDVGARVFGGSGGLGNRNSNLVIERLIESFGEASPVMQSLRGEAFSRIFRTLDNSNIDQMYVGDIASGLVRSIDDALESNGSTLSLLFNQSEMSALRNYADTLRRLVPPPNAINRSNSAYSAMSGVAEATRELFRSIPRLAQAIPANIAAALSLRLSRFGNPAAAASHIARPPVFSTAGRGLLGGAAIPLLLNDDEMRALSGYDADLIGRILAGG